VTRKTKTGFDNHVQFVRLQSNLNFIPYRGLWKFVVSSLFSVKWDDSFGKRYGS